MNIDSPPAWKRRRLTDIDPMDAEAAKAKLEVAKEKYGREVRVFETSKASQQAAQAADNEETDDFFEFTAEDYFHLMAAKKEDKYLKTRKIREAEQAARRSRLTKTVIRVRFPDDHTLEATFHPSEPIQSIFDLVKRVMARPEFPFYLYTTPPKKLIKDISQDFFAAGFVPGAIVFFSYDLPKEDEANSGPFLQEDLMSLKGLDELLIEPKPEPKDEPTQAAQAASADGSVAQEKKPVDKKTIKPKWLKM